MSQFSAMFKRASSMFTRRRRPSSSNSSETVSSKQLDNKNNAELTNVMNKFTKIETDRFKSLPYYLKQSNKINKEEDPLKKTVLQSKLLEEMERHIKREVSSKMRNYKSNKRMKSFRQKRAEESIARTYKSTTKMQKNKSKSFQHQASKNIHNPLSHN